MKKALVFILFISLLVNSCNTTKDKIVIAQAYYKVLNTGGYSKIPELLSDSILSKEIDYSKSFSQQTFIELLKWDATFNPEYKILEIKQEGEIVKAKISKVDNRIRFLHKEPIITNEVLRFQKNKVVSVEIVEYVIFNDSVFSENRSKLLNWVEKHRPDLNGFLHDQTPKGALKYLEAINLYEQAN